ncbi:MAG: hypothetical protein K5657_05640 [Desulfovibrio sp.]|nr:hypothetical protein [Desulfovibrio sp.]
MSGGSLFCVSGELPPPSEGFLRDLQTRSNTLKESSPDFPPASKEQPIRADIHNISRTGGRTDRMQLFHRFKEISDLFETGRTEQARQLLREILSHYVALSDESDRLRLRISTMEKIIEPEKNLFYANGFFWLNASSEEPVGPFCPKCMNNEGDLIFLEKKGKSYHCPYCNNSFSAPKESPRCSDFTKSVRPRQAHIINFSS